MTALQKKVRQAGAELEAAIPKVVEKSIRQFRYQFAKDQLDRRAEASLGTRSERLIRAWTHEVTVKSRPRVITGRAHFGRRDSFANMVARVHEYGATIRPKSGFLVFPIYRKYSRRPWPFKRSMVIIRTRKPVRIRPRLGLRRSWRAWMPIARRHVFDGAVAALKRGFR